MAKIKWEKPENDSFKMDIQNRTRAQEVAKKTEERLNNAVDVVTGMSVVKIPLDLLYDAPKNDETYGDIRNKISEFQKMKKAILRSGLLQPIIVWKDDKKDGYMILGGHSRKRVYEHLYKEEGLEEYKEIYAFVRDTKDLTEEEAKNIVIDSNAKRDDSDEATQIMETYFELVRREKEAEEIFYKSNGKYKRIRDVLGEMLGVDGKTVENIKALGSLGRSAVELLNETPLRRKHLLNPNVRNNKELLEELVNNKKKITADFAKLIAENKNADELKQALHEGIEAPEEPDTVTITVPDGKGIDIMMEIEVLLINKLNIKREDFTVKLKKKRKKTAKETASNLKK